MHLVIIRTGGSILNIDTYNCQELGLAKELTMKGWKVSLILAGATNEHRVVDHNGQHIDVFYVTFKSLNQALASFKGLFPLLEKLKPSLIQIHEFGMWMSYKVVRWAKKRNIPVFLIQGSYQPTQKPLFKQLEILFNNTIGKYILKNVAGIGCKSKMASRYVADYSERKTVLTPIGLDVERFNSAEDINWKDKLGIIHKHVLLYVGILEKRRNPLFLIDVAKGLPYDYVLLLVGGGPMENEVRKRISEQGVEGKCMMLGKLKQEQLPSLYKNADLFLLASDYEIYGMVLLEALFFGLPVITTMTAGSDILIEDGKNGFILPKDCNDWVFKITESLSDGQKLSTFKTFAMEQMREKYVWSRAVENFIKLYQRPL